MVKIFSNRALLRPKRVETRNRTTTGLRSHITSGNGYPYLLVLAVSSIALASSWIWFSPYAATQSYIPSSLIDGGAWSVASDFNQTAKPIEVAYAISLIQCSNIESTTETLSDAGIILRHSIHQNSVRNPDSGSRYDYKMYAIVHEQAKDCSQTLRDAGFEILVKPPPVKTEEIRGEYLRTHIDRAWCCGIDEFVKLYAYTIDAPIVVHLDMDKLITKPLDPLFDLMLHPSNMVARSKVFREVPNSSWPARIDAMFTKDWPQVIPGRKAAYQAGFIVLRPDPSVIEEVVEIIREGDFKEGFDRENGWGSMGYGFMVGDMAMQGLMAYYYDQKRPGTFVELNQCRYNHMGMDTKYNYKGRLPNRGWDKGRCRNDQEECEQCMETDVNDIYSIHFTTCHKPWKCISKGSNEFGINKQTIQEFRVNLKHCYELHRIWHEYRIDFEDKLVALTGDQSVLDGRKGNYKKDIFMGHCDDEGLYRGISGKSETIKRMVEMYI